jgi:hypothetical protein
MVEIVEPDADEFSRTPHGGSEGRVLKCQALTPERCGSAAEVVDQRPRQGIAAIRLDAGGASVGEGGEAHGDSLSMELVTG